MSEYKYWNNIKPLCPYCDKELEDAWELKLFDGETTKVDCPYCEKEYFVECVLDPKYTTKKLEVAAGE